MGFETKEERERRREHRRVRLLEYKELENGNWQRAQITWVVNTILITGSLIAAFEPTTGAYAGFPTPIVSLILVLGALVMHLTADKVTQISRETMKVIRKELGMTIISSMYEREIKGKLWYRIRSNTLYFLFLFLIVVYLFLLLQEYTPHIARIFSLGEFSAGLLLITLREAKLTAAKKESLLAAVLIVLLISSLLYIGFVWLPQQACAR